MESLYFCEFQQDLHVLNCFSTLLIIQPTLLLGGGGGIFVISIIVSTSCHHDVIFCGWEEWIRRTKIYKAVDYIAHKQQSWRFKYFWSSLLLLLFKNVIQIVSEEVMVWSRDGKIQKCIVSTCKLLPVMSPSNNWAQICAEFWRRHSLDQPN